MDQTAIIISVLTLLAGIGIFLIGCNLMSSSLEAMGGHTLRNLFRKASKSKWVGVGIGAAGTAAIQSSGATTVMVIGFINAGIISLTQAATIIFGANIGTTITGQIVALGMFGGDTVSTTVIFSALAGVGAFITSFAKKDSVKTAGSILAGFGMLFVGLSMMSGSMEQFAHLKEVTDFLAGISNAFLLVVIGALLTAVIQSSSVMTSIAITMVFTGIISLDQGIYITMGSNIGSCVVAIIAGMTSSINAKRASFVHLFFNIGGVVLFMVLGGVIQLVSGGNVSLGTIFEGLFPGAPQTQLAMFHTVFNVIAVIVAVPLTEKLVALVVKMIPDKAEKTDEEGHKLYYIDEKMLVTPAIAVMEVKNEILNMAKLARDNFFLSLTMISTLNFDEQKAFELREKELNFLNRKIVDFVVKLNNERLSERDHTYLSGVLHTVSDLERVGDYAENIVEYAEDLKSGEQRFSDDALAEIEQAKELVNELHGFVMHAYKYKDMKALSKALGVEEQIDDMTNRMAENHIKRLHDKTCSPEVGSQYISLASNTERVADHFVNMGNTIKDLV